MDKKRITGMGAALVDLFADVTEAELAALGSAKGSMSLLSESEAQTLQQKVTIHTRQSGGSIANSIAGIAALGIDTAFFGKVGGGELGEMFRQDLKKNNTMFPVTPDAELMTGRSIILITPDAERTMHTLLSASARLSGDDLDEALLQQSDIFFTEGYIWDTKGGQEAFLRAIEIVHAAGGKIAFSLSDAHCVGRHHSAFAAMLLPHIDILFANLEEAKAMFGTDDKAALATAARAMQLEAAITDGEKGAMIVTKDTIDHVSAPPVAKPLDLTGAGDQFAAGYLAGRLRGKSGAISGHMGSIAAGEVIKHFGPRPQADIQALFREHKL